MSQFLETISPIDGSTYVKRPYASAEQTAEAQVLSRNAQSQWQTVPIEERVSMGHKFIAYMQENKAAIGEEICWQMGRPIRYAAGEVDGLIERAYYMIDTAAESLATIHLPQKSGFDRYIKREPLGVVFIVAPWNYPYLTAINTIIPAILAGNSVILKPSSQTPLCGERFAAAFASAGLPDYVFQCLHLDYAATEKLIRSGDINQVCFTGSVPGGAMVERAAAGRFMGIGLELGGKDPAYVRADADLDHAVDTIIDGAFFNSGQSCCGIERIYVHADLFDQFVEKSVALIEQYKLGRPDDPTTTLGPMVRTRAADAVRKQVQEALQLGAQTHIDTQLFELDKPGSPYLAPQLLTNVDHSMRIMTEETFGPAVGVMKVSSDAQAIELMNDSEFGLTASVFTQDTDYGQQLGEKINTGTFFVNRCDYLDPALSWVGIKNSGRGCTLSHIGYENLTRPKSFHIKSSI
ncbi:MAG: aldehyde dehydrogenase family protein [Arenicella sp.]|nr:aldehyde dehydrogenase family protein [Arenicella sp.]